MPSHLCKHPTCTRIGPKPGWCAEHARLAPRRSSQAARERDRFYDQHHRDLAAKAFYNSSLWLAARKLRISAHPVCERCGVEWSRHVHHVIPLRKCTPAQRTDQDNLRAVCPACHNLIESESIHQEVA